MVLVATGNAGPRNPEGPVVAFFDVDGTLVYRTPESGPGMFARPRVVDAVCAFVRSGGIAVLSTGRSLCGVNEVRSQMPFGGFVTMDGAYVEFDGKAVVDQCFSRDLLEQTVEAMRSVDMSCFLQGTEICAQLSPDGRNPFGDVVAAARDIMGLAAIKPDLRFGKIDFFGDDYDRFCKSEFLARELTYYDVGDGCHELVMSGVNKGAGARALLRALEQAWGVAPSRVFTFGDSENDLSLFEIADVAVAMGQAAEHIRVAADYVTDTCADDGVATALEHFGFVGIE